MGWERKNEMRKKLQPTKKDNVEGEKKSNERRKRRRRRRSRSEMKGR
jgi:hypothetical protein